MATTFSLRAQVLCGLLLSAGVTGCGATPDVAVNTDQSVRGDLANSGSTGWKQVPSDGIPNGAFTAAPAVAIRGVGQLDLFARGSDGALWQNYAYTRDDWQTWSWLGWTPLDGALRGKPSASTWGIGRNDSLIVAAGGKDDRVRVRVWTPGESGHGGWSDWAQVRSEILAGDPTITFSYPYFLVFARGTDGGLYFTRDALAGGAFDPNGWSEWTGPIANGVLTSNASVATWNGALYVAARRTTGDYALAKSFDHGATWSAWSSIPSAIAWGGDPALSISPGGELRVFGMRAGKNEIWIATSSDDGASWRSFESAGDVVVGAPAAASPDDSLVQAFGLGADDALYWNRYQQ